MNRIAFYGSSLLSSYWNGAATYYRGILRALAALGWDITFLEPDVFDRRSHRDIEPPEWARVVVWEGTPAGLDAATRAAAKADVVVVASGIGYSDQAVLDAAMRRARPGALRDLVGRRRAGDAGDAARDAGTTRCTAGFRRSTWY